MAKPRIYLSPPHMSGREMAHLEDAFSTNWIAPLGPHVDAFEREFAEVVGSNYALALSSGTAALHLALLSLGIGPGDDVLVSTLTFAASVNPILYVGARPILIDSERESWNIDPQIVADSVKDRARQGRCPKALVAVHLYGQSANLAPLLEICDQFGITLIEDAAEALGGKYHGRSVGTWGKLGFFSFNGNKVITTSGGGMLVSDDRNLIAHARKLSTQARDPAPHYEHSEVGYNYRLSNVLAAIGRGQLSVLADRVEARRRNFQYYKRELGDIPGIEFMPEAPWGGHTRWLTTLTVNRKLLGTSREDLRLYFEAAEIEARPVWKPMHMQPVFQDCERIGGGVAQQLFEDGLCLPSGSALSEDELSRVVAIFKRCAMQHRSHAPA